MRALLNKLWDKLAVLAVDVLIYLFFYEQETGREASSPNLRPNWHLV